MDESSVVLWTGTQSDLVDTSTVFVPVWTLTPTLSKEIFSTPVPPVTTYGVYEYVFKGQWTLHGWE